MKRRHPIPEDPVVKEVRAARRKLWERAGGTFEGLLRLLDEIVPASPPKKSQSSDRRRKRKPKS